MRNYLAKPQDEGRRLDIVVAGLYPKLTRSSLEPLFKKELVRIEGRPGKASQKLHSGDHIEIDETLLNQKPPKIDLPVVYEDDDVIVIDKPAGVLTHSKGALNYEATVASFIQPKLIDNSLKGNRAGIVHRLDRGTSGLIVTAKNSAAQSFLQKQFSQRKVKKTYLAIIEGTPKPPQAVIDAPIARNPKRPQTFAVSTGGKESQTEYRVLKDLLIGRCRFTVIELKPRSGRTHQLRVHMAYIGHPIAGDNLYGRGGPQLMLHASKLELRLPRGNRRVFHSELPPRFREFMDG